MRRVLLGAGIVLVLVAFVLVAGGFTRGPASPTYELEFDNAFGLVTGAPFNVAGVPTGSIKSINLCYTDKTAHCQNPLDALVTVQARIAGGVLGGADAAGRAAGPDPAPARRDVPGQVVAARLMPFRHPSERRGLPERHPGGRSSVGYAA